MKQIDVLLSSLDKSWERFSTAWEKAQAKGSEDSVHDLRVGTRRLIATLELNRTISKDEEIAALRKRFKKILKRMGSLRDVQVELENLSQLRAIKPINDFKKDLKRCERQKINDIGNDLKGRIKRRLSKRLAAVRSLLEDLGKTADDHFVRGEIDNLLAVRHEAFWKARSRFKATDPDSLHQMRIGLKKLRYVVEAAQPILGSWAKRRSRQMHSSQQLMGDTRDLLILKVHLQKWADKQGRQVVRAIAPELARLDRKRKRLIDTIRESTARLEQLQPPRPQPMVKPSREATHAPLLRQPAVHPVAPRRSR